MKIITDSKQKDTIHVDELTDEHIVVKIYAGNPYILTRERYNNGRYRFAHLKNEVTNGNGEMYRFDTIKDAITSSNNESIAAFHQSDWKQALQWLIDNA